MDTKHYKFPLPKVGVDIRSNETKLPNGGVRVANNVDIGRSGAWTPTSAGGSVNLDGIFGMSGHYQRVGDIVSFTIRGTLSPTSTAAFELYLNLPVSSSFTSSDDCVGVIVSRDASHIVDGYVEADSSGDAIAITGDAAFSGPSGIEFSITGQYEVK